LQHLRGVGIRRIAVVTNGHEITDLSEVSLFSNPRWKQTGILGSLIAARSLLKGDILVAYGNVLFKRYILHDLMMSTAPVTIVVDGDHRSSQVETDHRVQTSHPPPTQYDEQDYWLRNVGADLAELESHGEWIGLMRVREEGMECV